MEKLARPPKGGTMPRVATWMVVKLSILRTTPVVILIERGVSLIPALESVVIISQASGKEELGDH